MTQQQNFKDVPLHPIKLVITCLSNPPLVEVEGFDPSSCILAS